MSANVGRRARRARLLIVGEGVPDDASVRLDPLPLHASNVFEALGALATATAGAPIGAVLIGEGCLPDDPRGVIEAMRRVDPVVRLVRLSANGLAPQGGADGFDGVIAAPVDGDTLHALLDGEGKESAGAAASPGRSESDPARTFEPEHASEPVHASEPASTSEPASEVEPAAAPPPTPDSPSAPLGDIDLVDAIMHDPAGVTARALELIRQHTGWDDLALIDASDAGPVGAAGAPLPLTVVDDEDDEEGPTEPRRLVTGCAAARELEPWAAWLAPWLALDHAHRRLRILAHRDDLTGTWNRRYFTRFLADTIDTARASRRTVTVMVFDIDDFKRYNDAFGHEAGDVILCETVSLLHSVIRTGDRVCRIGGDEFAVIFADLEERRETGSTPPASVEQIARRFQEQIRLMRFPKLGLEAPGNLSISAGLSAFPWDGADPHTLLRLADERALESKRRGKNHITFGPGAAHGDG